MTQVADDLDAQASDELEALRHEIEHLRRALSSRAQIDQAKGILMLRYGISAERAFDVLVRWSQQANVKLRVVAAGLLRIAESAHAGTSESDGAGVDLSWLAAQLRGNVLRPGMAGEARSRKESA